MQNCMFRKSLVLGIMMLFVVTGLIPNTVRDVSASDDELPEIEWITTSSGKYDDYASSLAQTNDGGYIIAGDTKLFEDGNEDIWLIKVNDTGKEEWGNTFGGKYVDSASSLAQTNDGGYIISGYTSSFGSGSSDIWLIKTDDNGKELWNVTFGGPKADRTSFVLEIADEGYVVFGSTASSSIGTSDLWLIKTDYFGKKVWDKKFGSVSAVREAYSFQQTADGGYILCGYTYENFSYHSDVIIIKTDSKGNFQWERTFGGTGYDTGRSVQQTADGGYIITGDFDCTKETGRTSDLWLIKVDSNGKKQWERTFGGTGIDMGTYVLQKTDGRYLVLGNLASTGIWLIETDDSGNEIWNTTYGGDRTIIIQETNDGGYVILGYNWLIKLKGDDGAEQSPTGNAGDNVTAYVGETVNFDGTATDDGTIVKYEWDFDGDGTYDWSSTTTGSTTHAYYKLGDYTAILRITYNEGLPETDTRTVTVEPNTYETDSALITYFGDCSDVDLSQPSVEEGLGYLRSLFETFVLHKYGISKVISFPFSVCLSLLIDHNYLLASEDIDIKANYDGDLLDNVIIGTNEPVFLHILLDTGPMQDDVLLETIEITNIIEGTTISEYEIPAFGENGFFISYGRYIIIPKEPFISQDEGDFFVEASYGSAQSQVRLDCEKPDPNSGISDTSTPGFGLIFIICAIALILFWKKRK